MHTHRPLTFLWIPLLAWIPGLWLSAAPVPVLTAHVEIPGRPIMLKVTPDQSAAVAVAWDGTDGMDNFGIALDLHTLSAPVVRARFPLQGHVVQFATSPDGKEAMFLVTKRTGATWTWEMVALDLSGPKPVERWRREIPGDPSFSATQIAIAGDASAYAVSLSESAILVQKASGQQFSVTGAAFSYRSSVKFSADGQHLVFGRSPSLSPGLIGIADLTSSPPTVYAQEFGGYFDRYKCVLAVLDSGYVILNDTRTPRLGIYAPEAGVPRVGALPGVSACSNVLTEDPKAGTLTFATTADIERIDVRDPRKPRTSGHWLIPAGRSALAISGELLFAARPNTQELQIYRLDNTRDAADFDWRALKKAHQRIMSEYRTSRKDAISRRFEAFTALREAGTVQAIERAVAGISPQQAAEILNDYGYLGTVLSEDTEGTEEALRRAIDLDPQRRVAYLNLVDLRRARLDQSVGIENRQAAADEVVGLYRKYLALGGKPSDRIDHFLIAAAASKNTASLCDAVAGYANNGALKDMIVDKDLGIPLNERRVDLLFTTEGTAHVPSFYAFDSDTDFPVDIKFDPPWAETLWGGDALGVLIYRGSPQVIHYRDVQHPVHTAPLTAGPSCEFTSSEEELVSPRADEPELCQDLVNATGPDSIEFNEPVTPPYDTAERRYSETHADGAALVDFDNTGVPKMVVSLQLTSGAGAGCDEQLFDVSSGPGADHDHDIMASLQSYEPYGRYPILPCGNTARFFVYRGKTYYESQPSAGAHDSWTQYHHVTRSEHGKVKDVCGITFKSHIKAVEPAAKDTSP